MLIVRRLQNQACTDKSQNGGSPSPMLLPLVVNSPVEGGEYVEDFTGGLGRDEMFRVSVPGIDLGALTRMIIRPGREIPFSQDPPGQPVPLECP